jgi:hypothetical protein
LGCNRCHAISDGDREAFGERCGSALARIIRGRPEPFKALWWHGDDVSILGALGGRQFGWGRSARVWTTREHAGAGLSHFGIENVVTFVVGDNVAHTADFEHMERTLGNRTRHRMVPRPVGVPFFFRRSNPLAD